MIKGRPYSSTAALVATWLGAAVGLGVLLLLARSAQGPLDDRDQAWQRPGFLDAGALPVPAPAVASGVPTAGRPTVVFFERANGLAKLCEALAESSLPDKAATAVVAPDLPPDRCDVAGAMVRDADATVARAYGMRRPSDGGPPVGYAVVDAAGAIRYRTLDPAVADQLGEVTTIVAALP